MTRARFLAVKNFETYQHYKNRTPPWIKLYNSLLDDYAFLTLSESAQINLVKLWLLASRHENRIPNDLAYISGKLLPKSAVDIEELILAGFIYQTDDAPQRQVKKKVRKPRSDRGLQRKRSASNVLAPRKQNAMLEREREGEGEREKETERENIKILPATRVENWVAAAVEIFARIGSFDHGHVGRYLKPVVARYGWEETEKGLRDYIAAETHGRKKTPAYFAQESGVWVVGAREDFRDADGIPTARADRIWGIAR